MTNTTDAETPARGKSAARLAFRVCTWLLAAGCFYLVYRKMDEAAAQAAQSVPEYLAAFFADANWRCGWR